MSGAAQQLKDEGTQRQVVAAGAIAGLVSRFCIAPLDVIKIRLQLQTHSLSDPLTHALANGSPIYSGTLHTLKHILRTEGPTGLWKGNIPAELLYLAYGSVQFSTYRLTSRHLSTVPLFRRSHPHPRTQRETRDAAISFVAGAFAGTVATTATYPLDLLRTRFAAQGSERVYASLAASIREITRHEGLPGFFRGLSAGVTGIVPYMGLFFAVYETLKLPLSELALPFGSSDAVAGTVASVTAKTVVYPLDTVRKRLQVQGPTRGRYVHRNIPEFKGVLGTIRAVLAREGMRGLYRGLGVSLIKAAPASAVTMWTYERAMGVMLAWNEDGEDL